MGTEGPERDFQPDGGRVQLLPALPPVQQAEPLHSLPRGVEPCHTQHRRLRQEGGQPGQEPVQQHEAGAGFEELGECVGEDVDPPGGHAEGPQV